MSKATLVAMMLLGLLGFAQQVAAASSEPVALSAQLTGDASRTILSIDLNRPFSYKVFALDNPYRVIIDMPAVEFRLPKGAGIQGLGVVGDYRYGQVGPGHSRLVINTTGPVLVESAGILSKDGQGQATFKIALRATDAATFLSHLPRRAIKAKPAPVAAALTEIPIPTAPSHWWCSIPATAGRIPAPSAPMAAKRNTPCWPSVKRCAICWWRRAATKSR
jgi:N-acetylmuramoyl-L-alanine amidase